MIKTCMKCNQTIPENTNVCPFCGTTNEQEQYNQAAQLPMGWYKFLINISLFLSALFYVVYGVL